MKNLKLKSILVTSGLICVCVFAGCAANNNINQQDSDLSSEQSIVLKTEEGSLTAETPGGNVNYVVYEQYGLIYDQQNGCYTYNGDVVRFFNDPVAGASFTNFFTGTVDIEAKRDENKELIGIEECSQEIYDMHTKKYATTSSVLTGTLQAETSQNSEEWLKDYESYGITYNKVDNRWYNNSEKIQILIDSEKNYVYSTDEDGVCLAVSRNDNHEVIEIKEISLNDAQRLLQANNSDKVLQSTFEGN